jgi:hypothetical protein
MSELYQEWSVGRPFVLLSSSPKLIAGKISRFLDRHAFPEREVWLRDWLKQKDIRQYKFEALRKLESRTDPGFIFIGDDAEYDPEVFAAFRERNPARTLAIYIRSMRGRPLPEGAVPFHSALEIALAELEAGRLSIPQVSRVGKAILDQGDVDQIIPYFASSPVEIAIKEKFSTLEKIIDHLNLRYAKIRADRKSR